MRLRLVIPAALAAAATYAALVRDELATPPTDAVPAPAPRSARSAHVEPVAVDTAIPSPPAPQSEPTVAATVPVPPDVASPPPVIVAPPAPPPVAAPAPPEPSRAPLSQFEDLAPSPQPARSQPSVYDLLAGTPKAEPEPEAAPPAEPEPAIEALGEHAPVLPDDPWNLPLDEGRFALGGWAASSGHTMVSAVTFRKRLSGDVAPDRIVLDIDASDNVPEGGLMVLSEPGFAPDRDGFTLLLAAAEPGPFSAAGSYRVLPAR